ncbi:hypothetical protein WJX72_008892 [[Myrmecia] bisecta]|uniref:Mediator complex subunit 15 KIX domain-containing protein n=1 Tax=[Myrmecia] bisecta TaxID=41462 RepID=A0AAW1QS20_9CHLO
MAATISKEDRDRATQHVHDELVKTGMQGMKPGEVEQLARGIEGFAWGKMTPASTQADYRARLQQKLISIINKWRAQQQQQIHPAQQAQQQQRQQQPGQQQQQQQQQTLAALGALSPEALAQRYAQLHAQMRQDYLPFVSNYLRLIDPRRHPTSQDLQAKQRTWQVIYQRLTRERTAHTSPVTAQELADLRSLDGKLRDHLLKVRVQQQRTQAAQQAQQAQQLQGQPAPGQPLQHALPAAQQAQQGMAQGQPAANAAVATAVAGSAPGTAPASVRAPGMAFASVSGSVPAGSATVPPSTASEAFPTHLSGGLDLRNQAPYTSMPTPPVLTPGTDLSAAGAAQDETGLVKQEPGGLQAPPAQQLLSLLRQQPAGAALEAGAAIGQLMWHSDLDTPPIPHYLQEGALPGWLSSAALPILSRSTGSVCIDSQSGPTSPASVFLGPSSLKRKASEDSDTDTLVSEHRQRLTDEVSQVGASLAGVMNVQIVNIGETDSGCLLEVQLEPPAAQQVQQAVPDAWRRLTLRISDRYPEEAPVMVFQSLRPGSAAPQADVARQVFETSISVLQAPLTLHTIADTWRSTLGSVVKGFEAHAAQAGSTLTA